MNTIGLMIALATLIVLVAGLFVQRLADYRFTLWIIIANLAALCFPQFFKSIGGVSLTNPWILLIMVQLIMFGMGTQMHVSDFYNVMKMPWAVIIGVSCQFLIMPLVGFTLARLVSLQPEIAAGLILIGSCSCGLASNVMTYMARGNLALSVTLTSLTTTLAPIITPLWMRVLAGAMVEVDSLKMSMDIIKMILVPILAAFLHDFLKSKNSWMRFSVNTCAGLGLAWLVWLACGGWIWLQHATQGKIPEAVVSLPGFVAAALVFGTSYHHVSQRFPHVTSWLPKLSMFGIIYYTLVATADGRDQLLSVGWILVLATTAHNLIGYTLGYWFSRMLGMNRVDSRTIAIEVGLQNGAMAIGIARGMDKLNTTGLAAILFSPIMNVTGSILANYWRRRPT